MLNSRPQSKIKKIQREDGLISIVNSETNLAALFNPLKAELISLKYANIEFMHNGGYPQRTKKNTDRGSWPNSEIICFPIYGEPANGKMIIAGKEYAQARHGISRDIPWTMIPGTEQLSFTQIYNAGARVPSTKPGSIAYGEFPFSFAIIKSYDLGDNSIIESCRISNLEFKDLPHQFAFHPAFKRDIGYEERVLMYNKNGKQVGLLSLKEIEAASNEGDVGLSDAVLAEAIPKVVYATSEKMITLTHNLGNVALWSPNMAKHFAIEPVTHLPPVHLAENIPFVNTGFNEIPAHGFETYWMRIEVDKR